MSLGEKETVPLYVLLSGCELNNGSAVTICDRPRNVTWLVTDHDLWTKAWAAKFVYIYVYTYICIYVYIYIYLQLLTVINKITVNYYY